MARKNWLARKRSGKAIRAAKSNTPTELRIRAAGVAATIRAAEGDGDGAKLGTFEGNAYTGAAMRPEGWFRPIVVDLDGVKVSDQHRPVLRQHDHNQIVGHTESVTVGDSGIGIAGVFSGEKQHTDKVTVPAKNGFKWQLSIGATPIRTEELDAGKTATVNGREVTGPLTISRETELGEISFVPLGADGNTSATVQASKGSTFMNEKMALKFARMIGVKAARKFSDDEIDKMSDDDAKAALKKCMADDAPPPDKTDDDPPPAKGKAKAKAADDDAADDDADDDDEDKKAEARAAARIKATRKAEADEVRRCDAIRAAANKHGVSVVKVDGKDVVIVAHAIEQGWSAEKAELEALRAARPTDAGGPHLHFSTAPEMNEAVLEAAILHAARHQYQLEDESFYSDSSPDGRTRLRRVPESMERMVRAEIKARYPDQVQQAAHTMFKGRISPHQIFQIGFRAHGSRHTLDLKSEQGVRSMLATWDHLEPQGIRAEGASTISIANVLANVLNKFSLQGYLFTEQAWRQIAAIRSVNDMKPTKSINLLGDVMYKQFGPMGELIHATLSDQAFANQVSPYGRIITIPWTYIVNDDLGMLTGVPMKIGQGAGLALNDAFWTVWKNLAAGTVNGDDGTAFWRTTSSVTAKDVKEGKAYKANKTSGAGSAFSNSSLKTMKSLFDNQVDPNGNPLGFDEAKPRLLFGPTLWQDVMTTLSSPALVAIALASSSPTVQGGNNVWQNFYEPVMSRYVENVNYVNTTTGWWMLMNPAALPAIEVAFLNGADTPTVLTAGPDYQFDRLGISIRGTMPFGVTQQNFRGGVYSVGA